MVLSHESKKNKPSKIVWHFLYLCTEFGYYHIFTLGYIFHSSSAREMDSRNSPDTSLSGSTEAVAVNNQPNGHDGRAAPAQQQASGNAVENRSSSPTRSPKPRKERFAAKSFQTGGVNLAGAKKNPSLPTVVDIKSLCSLETSFDENANNDRLQKMQQWQRKRKQDVASKVLCNFLLSVGLRRRYTKFHSAVVSTQCNFRRFRAASRFSSVRRVAVATQRLTRGYLVRRLVCRMRQLVDSVSKLRVVYNLKVRRSKRRAKAATVIQCTCRRMLAQRQLCRLFKQWTDCNELMAARRSIIDLELGRKRVLVNSFIKKHIIRSTLWFCMALTLFATATFTFSYSDAGMAAQLKESDSRYMERVSARALQLYYPDTTTEDMIPSLIERFSTISVSEFTALVDVWNANLDTSAASSLFCSEETGLSTGERLDAPSWTASKFIILLLAGSVMSSILGLVTSVIITSFVCGHVGYPIPRHTFDSWGAILHYKDDFLADRAGAISCGRTILISVVLLSGCWIALAASVLLGVVASRFHFFWFVYPYVTDACGGMSLLRLIHTSKVELLALPLQFLLRDHLPQVSTVPQAAMVAVQVAEVSLYSLLVVLFLRSVVGYISLSKRLRMATASAQAELTGLTRGIDAVLKHL